MFLCFFLCGKFFFFNMTITEFSYQTEWIQRLQGLTVCFSASFPNAFNTQAAQQIQQAQANSPAGKQTEGKTNQSTEVQTEGKTKSPLVTVYRPHYILLHLTVTSWYRGMLKNILCYLTVISLESILFYLISISLKNILCNIISISLKNILCNDISISLKNTLCNLISILLKNILCYLIAFLLQRVKLLTIKWLSLTSLWESVLHVKLLMDNTQGLTHTHTHVFTMVRHPPLCVQY